jgi:hypothetical protein
MGIKIYSNNTSKNYYLSLLDRRPEVQKYRMLQFRLLQFRLREI